MAVADNVLQMNKYWNVRTTTIVMLEIEKDLTITESS